MLSVCARECACCMSNRLLMVTLCDSVAATDVAIAVAHKIRIFVRDTKLYSVFILFGLLCKCREQQKKNMTNRKKNDSKWNETQSNPAIVRIARTKALTKMLNANSYTHTQAPKWIWKIQLCCGYNIGIITTQSITNVFHMCIFIWCSIHLMYRQFDIVHCVFCECVSSPA